jgi:hypothetical protein
MRLVFSGFMAAISALVLAAFQVQPVGQDVHKVGPGAGHAAPAKAEAPRHGPQHVLELDNESVTVLRIRIGAREKIPMHEVTPRVAVWLTDAHLRMTDPDGTTKDQHIKAGQTGWVSGHRHAGENLADQPIEFIAVVPKASGKSVPAR